MPVDLAQNSTFFTPEQQMKMFERGVNGIDLTNGMPQRRPDITQTPEFKEMQNIYRMVQDGELVPKNLIQQTQVQQPQYSQPVEKQYVPAQQAQYEQQAQAPVQGQEDDLMKILFPDRNTQAAEAQAPVQQVAPQQTYQQSEQPRINWDEEIQKQQNVLLQESAKKGIKGEDVIGWMSQLNTNDYLEMYQMFNQASTQPVQQQQAYQAPVQNHNGSMINWATNQSNQVQTQQQFMPSIADLPGSNITTVQRSQEVQQHPFGLNPDRYR